jgi:hypothetical protein
MDDANVPGLHVHLVLHTAVQPIARDLPVQGAEFPHIDQNTSVCEPFEHHAGRALRRKLEETHRPELGNEAVQGLQGVLRLLQLGALSPSQHDGRQGQLVKFVLFECVGNSQLKSEKKK